MANDLNRVFMIARATKDPELKFTQGGTAVASLSIANNKTFAQNNEKKEQVSFFSCIAWGKLGETIAQYVKKGQRIGIDGRLQQRSWQDQSGQKRSTVEIVIENVQFLEQRKDGQPAESSAPLLGEEVAGPAFEEQSPHFSDDDISF